LLPLQVARDAASKVRPGGTLLFMGGTGGRGTAAGLAFISALTAALPALTKNLALELAPIRVNLIAAGFVDTPLSARSWATSWTRVASSSARRCRSDASSARPTSPHWPSTS
jgi:NAD(P)-dependent dehydrogenase (short-subunit alcohol dehydrogenase family)